MTHAHQADMPTGVSGDAVLSPSDPVSVPGARRRPLLWAGLAVPVAGWAALALGAVTPLKGWAEGQASAALGRQVSIDGPLRILVTPFSLTFTGERVRIANPKWALDDHLLDAASVSVRLAAFDLMIGKPGLRALAIQDGTLDLERSRRANRVNWAIGKPGTLFDAAAIRRVDADRLAVHFRDHLRGIEARLMLDAGGRGIVDMTGQGSIGARRFALTGSVKSADEAPATLDLRARDDDFAFVVHGEAGSPFALRANGLEISARGRDFAQLAALGGVMLPTMPDYDVRATMGVARGGWHFRHVEGRIGHTDLAGKLTLDQRHERPRLVAELASRSLDMGDARRLFGLQDTTVATADDEEGLHFARRLLPDATLSPEALRRFDAVVEYRADAVGGTQHAPAHLAMTLALVDGRLQVSPASVDLGGGFVSSDLFIDARSKPALVRGDIRLSPAPMGRLLRGWGISPAGTTAMVKGRIQLAGRGATLREAIGNADGRIALIIPAGSARVTRASASALDMATIGDAIFREGTGQPADIHCGLVAFTVRRGLATVDPILIDTGGHVLRGTGKLDLRNERLDLRLETDSKTMAFFARPYPVRIEGTLTDPVLAREPIEWFSRSGLFGLPLPNLTAILGFVDPDDAQAPACGPVLRGDRAAAQRDRDDTPRDMGSARLAALR